MGLTPYGEKNLNKCKEEMLGSIFVTNEGFDVKVLEYENRHKVKIKFLDEFGFETYTTSQNIKKGQIKNPYNKSVYGIGYYGVGKYKSRVNGKKTIEYIKWFSMFNRCYSQDYLEKYPGYKDCSVDRSFHCFQDFAKWFNENYYEFDGCLELDKDLLVKGNKVYSAKNCCFLPKEINIAIRDKRKDRDYMQCIYDKYKTLLPTKILDKIQELC